MRRDRSSRRISRQSRSSRDTCVGGLARISASWSRRRGRAFRGGGDRKSARRRGAATRKIRDCPSWVTATATSNVEDLCRLIHRHVRFGRERTVGLRAGLAGIGSRSPVDGTRVDRSRHDSSHGGALRSTMCRMQTLRKPRHGRGRTAEPRVRRASRRDAAGQSEER
jgi:hypothetical protein